MKIGQLRRLINEELMTAPPSDTEFPDIQQMARMHPDALKKLATQANNRYYAMTCNMLAGAHEASVAAKQGDAAAVKLRDRYIQKAKDAWQHYQEVMPDQERRAGQAAQKFRDAGKGDQQVAVGQTIHGPGGDHLHATDTHYSTGRRRGESPIR